MAAALDRSTHVLALVGERWMAGWMSTDARTVLPEGLRRFAELSAAHIRPESADDDIARLVGRFPPPAHDTTTTTTRLAWIIGAVAVVLAAFLIWFFIRDRHRGHIRRHPDHGPVFVREH